MITRTFIKNMFFLCLFFFLFSSMSFAQSQNLIHLLTVSEFENGSYEGGVASLDLIIQKGSGAIFIESFPLSNVDTQATTRIATDIACSYSKVNCNSYDFFYTLRTNSGFVRGPSAGGATALLALATLNNIHLDPLAMTGGISSGGLITAVGGVKEKALAAIKQNISLIILPALTFNITPEENESILNSTTLLLKDIQTPQVSLHKIYSLSEAYFLATGKSLPQKTISSPPKAYTLKMKETSELLCLRSADLIKELQEENITNSTKEFYNKSLLASAQGDYYSAASYCYSANLHLREAVVDKLSTNLLEENLLRLNQSIFSFENQIDDYSLKTFSDLEAYIIVKERLDEAKEYVENINATNISTIMLSYGIERYYSAVAWSGFFGLDGAPLDIDEDSLRTACIDTIKEVESRSNYLKTTIAFVLLDNMYTQLNAAYENYNKNNYPLCIFKASKAKASANLFMSSIQEKSQLKKISEIKLQRAQELIYDQQEKGIFPILGYSYYEYSKRLFDDQPYTSLLFTEYALAMSDVTNYFPKSSSLVFSYAPYINFIYLLGGLFMGFLIAQIPSKKKKKPSKKRKSSLETRLFRHAKK